MCIQNQCNYAKFCQVCQHVSSELFCTVLNCQMSLQIFLELSFSLGSFVTQKRNATTLYNNTLPPQEQIKIHNCRFFTTLQVSSHVQYFAQWSDWSQFVIVEMVHNGLRRTKDARAQNITFLLIQQGCKLGYHFP